MRENGSKSELDLRREEEEIGGSKMRKNLKLRAVVGSNRDLLLGTLSAQLGRPFGFSDADRIELNQSG